MDDYNPMVKTRTVNVQKNRQAVLLVLDRAGKETSARKNRISHVGMLDSITASFGGTRGIVEIYRHEVLPAKTRTIHLLGQKCAAKILHSLLGFEVQAGFKRIQCPDLVTARYLKIFSELGCRRIRIPYDPTLTSGLIAELETAQKDLVAGVAQHFPESCSIQAYVLRKMYHHLRSRLRAD